MKKWNVIAQSDTQYNNDMGWFFRSEHETKEEAEAAREALQKTYDEQARTNTPAYGITSPADLREVAVIEVVNRCRNASRDKKIPAVVG